MKLNTKGQSFIELIIALVLVSIALSAVVSVLTRSVSDSTFTKNKALATAMAEETHEWLRSQRDVNFANFYQRTNTSWCLVSLSFSTPSHAGTCTSSEVVTQTIFRREVTFARNTPSQVTSTVRIYWSDQSGEHSSDSTAIYTNWKGNP